MESPVLFSDRVCRIEQTIEVNQGSISESEFTKLRVRPSTQGCLTLIAYESEFLVSEHMLKVGFHKLRVQVTSSYTHAR